MSKILVHKSLTPDNNENSLTLITPFKNVIYNNIPLDSSYDCVEAVVNHIHFVIYRFDCKRDLILPKDYYSLSHAPNNKIKIMLPSILPLSLT